MQGCMNMHFVIIASERRVMKLTESIQQTNKNDPKVEVLKDLMIFFGTNKADHVVACWLKEIIHYPDKVLTQASNTYKRSGDKFFNISAFLKLCETYKSDFTRSRGSVTYNNTNDDDNSDKIIAAKGINKLPPQDLQILTERAILKVQNADIGGAFRKWKEVDKKKVEDRSWTKVQPGQLLIKLAMQNIYMEQYHKPLTRAI